MTENEVSTRYFGGAPCIRFSTLVSKARQHLEYEISSCFIRNKVPAILKLKEMLDIANGINDGRRCVYSVENVINENIKKRIMERVSNELSSIDIHDSYHLAKICDGDDGIPRWLSNGKFTAETPDIPDDEYEWFLVATEFDMMVHMKRCGSVLEVCK